MTEPAWPSATLALAAELISRPSVTPDDAGCQRLLAARLEAMGFACTHLRYGEVDNLWAVRGSAGPLFVFAGHTDVVPPGPLAAWTHPPFEPRIENGLLHGRGAAAMKGSLAAMVPAGERLLARARLAQLGGMLALGLLCYLVVLRAFGRLPKRGEATTMEGLRFRVLRADSRRLHTLQVERLAPSSPADPAA